MIKILHVVGSYAAKPSVRSFEGSLAYLGRAATIRELPMHEWQKILGPETVMPNVRAAAPRFRDAFAGVDFVAPWYKPLSHIPVLLAIRNEARSPTRLLMFAIASAQYAAIWSVIRPLLRPGDRIVAPTNNTRDLIQCLSPELLPYVRLHKVPVAPLPVPVAGRPRSRPRHVVTSICRITPEKLVHRQLEALAVLRNRGRRVPFMNIVGPAGPTRSNVDIAHLSRYHLDFSKWIGEFVRRHRLEDHVRLFGLLWDPAERGRLLRATDAYLNLSVSPAESYGTACVEALGAGVPVLGTRWDGLPDTIGRAGAIAPVILEREDCAEPTVSPEAIADGFMQLLDDPPSADVCRDQARLFAPDVTVPPLIAMCEEALAERDAAGADTFRDVRTDEPAAPREGLLSATAPLTGMAWSELFELCRGALVTRSAATRDDSGDDPSERSWSGVSSAILMATKPSLMRVMMHRPPTDPSDVVQLPTMEPPEGADHPIERGLLATRRATMISWVACLRELHTQGRDAVLASSVDLPRGEPPRADVESVRARLALARGATAEAFTIAEAALCSLPPVEVESNRLAEFADIAMAAGEMASAIGALQAWLTRYPDALDAGYAQQLLDRCRGLGAFVGDPALARVSPTAPSSFTGDDFVRRLQGFFGPELRCVVVGGPGANDPSAAATKDTHWVAIVDTLTPAFLADGNALLGNRRDSRWTIRTVSEWRGMSDLLPQKHADLMKQHRVVFGRLRAADAVRIPVDGSSISEPSWFAMLGTHLRTLVGERVRFRRRP